MSRRSSRRATTSPGRATGPRPRARSSGRSPRTPRRPARTVRASRGRPAVRGRAATRAADGGAQAGRCTRTDRRARRTPGHRAGDTVTETGDQFAGTSAAEHEAQPAGGRGARARDPGHAAGRSRDPAEEWRDPEPVAEGDPDIDAAPTGTLVGGTPVGMDADAVEARAELARWLDRADFPSTGPELVEAARDHRAPDAVVAELRAAARGRDLRADRRRRPRAGLPDRDLSDARAGSRGAGSGARRPPPRRSPRRRGGGTAASRGSPSPPGAGPARCRPGRARRCRRRRATPAPGGCPRPGA